MKLYYNPLSTYSQKVLIALYEKDIPFEGEIVDLMNPEKKEAYRKVYPLGKIPLLIRDDGWKIPESSIIIEFLDTSSERGPRLLPADPDASRRTRFTDRMYDLYVNDSVTTLLFQSMKPEEQRDAERIEKARFYLETMYTFLDQDLKDRTWAMGEEFSLADCAASAALFYAGYTFPFDRFPAVQAYFGRLQERPAIRRVAEEAAPYVKKVMASMS